MNPGQLRLYVIRPTLELLDLWSLSAENLLLGTAAQESKMGFYLKQIGGPARGIYQIEPRTHTDVQINFLAFREPLANEVMKLSFAGMSTEDQLVSNLAYATAIARIMYLRVKTRLPDADDIEGLAKYWKTHYNTRRGRGTEQEFIKNYVEFISF